MNNLPARPPGARANNDVLPFKWYAAFGLQTYKSIEAENHVVRFDSSYSLLPVLTMLEARDSERTFGF